jgi:intermembrane space import and assembly protein 40
LLTCYVTVVNTVPAPKIDSDLKTVDAVIEEKKRQIRSQPALSETLERTKPESPEKPAETSSETIKDTKADTASSDSKTASADVPPTAEATLVDPAPTTDNNEPNGAGLPGADSPEELEEQADQQGAFNPETGEINWDCPCLGGMAHGPCGEQFRAAFSCFVYSQEEPKGMDCIEKFQYVT